MNKLSIALTAALLGITAGACTSQKKANRSQARTELGQAYMTEKNDELAIETLREATKLDKRNPEAWHTLAMAYMRKGAFEESEKAFKKALRRSPDIDASILNNYGYMLIKLGRAEEGIEHLEAAREDLTYRKPAILLNSLGFAYLELEQCDLATARLQEAVTRSPKFCQAWFHLGLANECSGNSGQALDAFDKVIGTCPEQAAGAWLQVCSIEQGRGRYAEAIDACEELLMLPDLPNDLLNDVNARLSEMRVAAQ